MIEELVVDSEARFASGEEVGDYLGAVGRGNGVDDLVDIFVAVSIKICGEDSSAEADVEKIYLVVSGRLLDLLEYSLRFAAESMGLPTRLKVKK